MTSPHVVGLVLAAGEGSRLGQPKALVTDGPDLWVARTVTALRAGGVDDVRVVVGADREAVRAAVPAGCTIIEAVDWHDGMGASLRAGLTAIGAGADDSVVAALVMLVDTPGIGADVVRRLTALVRARSLARAVYNGQPSHPVLLGRDHWPGVLATSRGDTGARDYLRRAAADEVECADIGSGLDVDTPELLHQWRALGESPAIGHPGRVDPHTPAIVSSVDDLAARLSATGYLTDEGLATIGYLALAMQRPLLLEGEPGTGKTALAEALAEALDLPLIRLQCHEGIDASQALYDWDFARQILHLRTIEATRGGAAVDEDEVEKSLFDERFLLARPIVQALRDSPVVLLIDEIDRADDEFEAFLLEVLSTNQVTIPEYGTVTATTPPVVVVTSNRTREVHDALKRRCLYHWVDHPGLEREIEIVHRRLPEVPARLAEQVARATSRLRMRGDLVKPPGVAETLDWARALHTLSVAELDLESAAATLGAVLKYREDSDRVRASLDKLLS